MQVRGVAASSGGPQIDNDPNASNGKGTDAEVILSEGNGWFQVGSNDRTEKRAPTPTFIVLGAELVHSLATMDGVLNASKNKVVNMYTDANGKRIEEWQNQEEFTAHGIGSYGTRNNSKRNHYPTENSLRSEHGLKRRTAYEQEPNNSPKNPKKNR